MDYLKIGDFLKTLRKAKGLTQEEVANALYLSAKTISRWESGVGMPDINIIESVAQLYDVTVDEILKGQRKNEQKQLSEATIHLQEKNTIAIIINSIIKKYNLYFIIAVSIYGLFLLIGLIIGLLLSKFASIVMMPIGLFMGIFVMFIGNRDIRHQYCEQINDQVIGEKIKKELVQKNISFADITIVLYCLIVGICAILINSNFIQYLILISVYIVLFYLFIRSWFTKSKLYNNKKVLINRLSILLLISSLISIGLILDTNVVYPISVSHCSYCVSAFYVLEIDLDMFNYLFRIIGLILIIISVIGIIIAFIKKNSILTIIMTIIGVIGNVVMFFDFNWKCYGTINILGFAMLIFTIINSIIIKKIMMKKEIINNCN